MKVYNYDKNGVFTCSTVAKLDPKESAMAKKEMFLVPANATLKKPPACGEKEVAVFDNGKWLVSENNVGTEYYLPGTMEQSRVTTLGALPDGAIIGINPAIAESNEEALANIEATWDEFDSAKSIAELKVALKKILGG